MLKEERFSEGDYVVEQGGSGDKFYIVIEGKLVAEKYERCSLDPKIVFHYK
jgi:CRP-like cAMP-binding protein